MRAGVAAKLRAPRRGSGRRAALASVAAVGLAVLAAACGPASAGSSASVGTTPVSGGTVTYADQAEQPIDYIFPFTNSGVFYVTNTNEFQYLMYRPLYWFGQGVKPYLNTQLSLADPPTFHGRQVTIRLKPYKWSNGQSVTAQNVMFWINMQLEDGVKFWGGQVKGGFPFNVTDIQPHGTDEITMIMNKPYSAAWFTDNELSQITPMPEYWDRTSASTPSDCSTKGGPDCTAVYHYLDSQAGVAEMGNWAKSPLWSITDGPWHVLSANSDGTVALGINKHYSGPLPAHHVSEFVEEPFTTEQAEFNVLQDPQGTQKLDVGYLPTVDAPVPPPGSENGGNPPTLTGYNLDPLYPWALNYGVYNYDDPADGAIFGQKYFREAFQSLVDQEGVIDGPLHGYGKPTIGPVSSYPVTSFLSPDVAQKGDQWELNVSQAESLLKGHGWSFVPGGADKCVRAGAGPADCGPGVRSGAQLSFSMWYSSGVDWMYSATKELISNASLVGVQISATSGTVAQVAGMAAGYCTNAAGTQITCPHWQIADWGAWTYSPDYLPTGEELFDKSPYGGEYDSQQDDALIGKTLEARSNKTFGNAMDAWENYLAPQLPVIYEPETAILVESASNLHIGAQPSTLSINPEDWYYLK